MFLSQQTLYRGLVWVLWSLMALLPMACNSSGDSDSDAGPSKSWTHPVDTSDFIGPSGGDADDAVIAMNAAGDALVAWFQYDGSDDQIFISEYHSSAWSHPADLGDNISPDGQTCEDQQVAMDAAGDAIVVWTQRDGANDLVFMSEYRNSVWSHPADLSDSISLVGQNANSPQVAMDDAGNAIVVWTQNDGANNQIFMSEYRSGAWSHPANLSDNISPDGQDARQAKVAMDGAGNAIVVWRQFEGANDQIFMSEYRSNAWSHPANLSDNISPDGTDVRSPRIAMNAAGDAIVAWEQYDATYRQVFISEYRNSAWSHPVNLADHINPDGGSAGDTQVAMDAAGNAIVVWLQSDGVSRSEQLYMSEYRNSAWSHPADLNDHISQAGDDPDDIGIAMDDDGNAVMVWMQYDGADNQIFISEYRNNTWTHPADLNDSISPDGSNANDPLVAMDGAGNAIVAWRQDGGSEDLIFMSEYR